MMRNLLGLATAATLLAVAMPVQASNWVVDYGKSQLGFIGTQGSTSFTGEFKKFQATIDFDPAKPETGKIAATIDMASATAGSDERDSALPGNDWFDTSKFPQAQFATTSIKPDTCPFGTPAAAKCFKADATLTIKGVTKPVALSFYIAPEGDHTRAKGDVKLIRTDFGVGQGQWASEAYVKRAVDVTIDITARPAP
jgi:polyisoprenoid-binding protein YceI